MDNLEQIEAWLSGGLGETERAAFEQKMEADPAFAAEVDLVRNMIGGVRRAGARDLARQIEAELEAENFFKAPPPPDIGKPNARQRPNWLLVAAGIALMVGVGLWAFWPEVEEPTPPKEKEEIPIADSNQTPPPAPVEKEETNDVEQKPTSPSPPSKSPGRKNPLDDAFAAHYTPEQKNLPDVIGRLRGSGLAAQPREYRTQLADALALYQTGKYTEARSALSAFLDAHPDEDRARLYLGLTELALGQYAQATAKLLPLAQDEDFAYQQSTRWYLALAHARQGNEQQAVALMQALADDAKSDYKQPAKQFLDALKK